MSVSRGDRIRLKISRSQVYLRIRDLLVRSGRDTYWVVREDLVRRYLFGEGIEIGALTAPVRTPPGITVRYVDRATRDELIAQEGPSLRSSGVDPEAIVEVDFVADAERLDGIADQSMDFAIALHVLEHVEDPVRALKNLVRVVRPGGRVMIGLPDPRTSFDQHRARTTVAHVLADHRDGPAVSRADHHLEWARDIEGLDGEAARLRAAEFAERNARHHFHVWELADFLQLVLALDLAAEVTHAQSHPQEFTVVLTVREASPRLGVEDNAVATPCQQSQTAPMSR